MVSAVSEFPVGVDAEHVRAFDKALIERFFTPEEQKYIASSHTVDEAQTRFFDIWTTKEAYFKCGYENLVSFLKVDSLTVKGKVSKRYGKLLITVVGDGLYTEVEDVTERVIAFFGENG